ncbi:MAG: Uma2 family endonuclease [Peptococcaceae bacterium]|nr:Uma2 family endonuclease [Peptococcaceae bacterium]
MPEVNPHLKFNYEDYCLLPEDRRVELIGGDFYLVPSPSVIHQRIAANIEDILRGYVRENQLGEVFYAPLDVVLSPHDVVQPDVMFISNGRRGIVTDANIQGAPDLVVEVLSPSTGERDRTLKKKLYARSGVRELWLVNAASQTVEVYNLETGEEAPPALYVRSGKTPLLSGVLSGLAVDLDRVF